MLIIEEVISFIVLVFPFQSIDSHNPLKIFSLVVVGIKFPFFTYDVLK
jgi:hypothetical protein